MSGAKDVVITLRVTEEQKAMLQSVGGGKISEGFARIYEHYMNGARVIAPPPARPVMARPAQTPKAAPMPALKKARVV
jgi:hypothetical protein